MKQLAIIVVCIQMAISATSCDQENKNVPLDFVRSMWNVSANTKGRIQAETWYKDVGNEAGNAHVYMIHKNGGDWWHRDVKKKYPQHVEDCVQMFAKDYAVERLLKQDSIFVNDYNKWAFFVDKKHLKGQPNYGDDFFQLDKDENSYLPSEAEIQKIKKKLDYYEKPNITLEVILYEQKAGSKQWVEIDRRKYRTDQEGNRIYPKGEHWESDFIDQKLKESNTHSPRR